MSEDLLVSTDSCMSGYIGYSGEFLVAFVNAGYRGPDLSKRMENLRNATKKEKQTFRKLKTVTLEDILTAQYRGFEHPCVLSDGSKWIPPDLPILAFFVIANLDVWCIEEDGKIVTPPESVREFYNFMTQIEEKGLTPIPAIGTLREFAQFVQRKFDENSKKKINPLATFQDILDDEDRLCARILLTNIYSGGFAARVATEQDKKIGRHISEL